MIKKITNCLATTGVIISLSFTVMLCVLFFRVVYYRDLDFYRILGVAISIGSILGLQITFLFNMFSKKSTQKYKTNGM